MKVRKSSVRPVVLLLGFAWAGPLAAQQGPPAPAPLGPVSFPEYYEARLNNGAQLIVVENHEQPVVTVNLRIKSGSAYDPDGKEGLAGLTADMLNKGTKDRDAKQIAEAIDFIGASVSIGAGEDWTSGTATALSEYVDDALEILADIVINPTFPADELEIERKRILTALKLELSQAEAIAQRRFIGGVYGDHPYANLPTEASVEAIGPADLVEFHRAHYRPNNALFVVAGDVDPKDIKKRLDRQFGDWKREEVQPMAMAAAPERSGHTIRFYHKPGSVQAVVRMGHLMVPATDPDWPTLDVALRILGGGSQGWLYQTLRQEKGYTYGAYAFAPKRNDRGYLMAVAEVRNEVTDSAMTDMFALLDRIRAEPVPASDLDLAKNYITGSFPRQIETPQQVADQIATVQLRGLPKDYLKTYRGKVARVSTADVQRAMDKHLHPDRVLVVVVGDANQIYDKVASFGEVELFDVEGNPMTLADLEVKAAEIAFDASAIEPATLVYSLNFQGNPVGEITTSISRESREGRDVVSSVTTGGAMGMSLEQKVSFDSETFTGIESQARQSMGAQGISVDLKLEGGRITGSSTGMSGETREIDAEVVEGTLLPGMDDFVVWLADLETGTEISLPAFDALSGQAYTLKLKVVDEVTVSVAAGEFEAYQLEASGAQGSATLYARVAYPHIVLKQEPGGQPIVIELKEIR